MSKFSPFCWCFLFLFAFSSVQAGISRVAVTVKSVDLSPKAAPKGKPKEEKPEVEKRQLEIKIRNISQLSLDGLLVKYYFLGHAAGNSTIKILSEGEKSQSLAPGAEAIVTSDTATATFTPAHTPKSKGKARPQRVKADGDKFSGWAVRVLSDGVLQTENYSTPSVKAVLPPVEQQAAPVTTPVR
ncbi:MAG TPA: hypothetical protein VIT91_13495 [Chthoniobacterales bacterium]